ncbi:MAG TPA: 16S rRNA (cytidine(1402)-2'-O)-methyltransferase [Saprospiraceae bacterium]|nr:16S rRNA (cytidine(1402)-2'-O)-methyltransferase [Saprospiraceae bacterium]
MLYIVPTPIGNLGDITYRAVEVLSTVDLILAEDTRVTKRLLDKYEIKTPLKSYHAFNEHQATQHIIEELQSGKNIALVSDAGTPGISDPGFLLTRACREANEAITVLPGPTAFVPALVGSGFPCDRFHFEGFLPHKKGRNTRWKFLNTIETTIVLYESPFRVLKCLEEINSHLGERNVCVARELSKLHEQFHFGTPVVLTQYFENHPEKVKGEMVVIISPKAESKEQKKEE